MLYERIFCKKSRVDLKLNFLFIKSMPLLSTCIASYNVEKYISECLSSIFVFEKTLDREIIIVDDCSSDDTVKIIESLMKKHPEENIRLIRNKRNLWPAGSYNVAAENSKGKYITFLDSDDFLIASGFSAKIALLEENPELQIVYGNGVFYEKGQSGIALQNHIQKLLNKSIEDIREVLYTTIPMLSVSCSVIRRDFFTHIGWFDTACQSNDWVLNLRIFQNIEKKEECTYVLDPVFAYRIHSQNISKDQKKMTKLLTEVVDRYHGEKYKNIGYSNIYFFVALNNILQHRYIESFVIFRKSLEFQFRFWRILLYVFTLVSPVTWISKTFPRLFSFLKKIMQKIGW